MSKLLEHLRTKGHCTCDQVDPNTLDALAGGEAGAPGIAERAAKALSFSTRENVGRKQGLAVRTSTTGVLDLENMRLEVLPEAVWRAGVSHSACPTAPKS
jgi:hypothetical protein